MSTTPRHPGKKAACRTMLLAASLVAPAVACGSSDAASDARLTVTVAGDAEAVSGFAFPPASASDPAFVDGWEVAFERILVTVGRVSLSADPDTSPTDQAQTGGPVASVRGPWAVDVSRPGNRAFALATNALAPRGGQASDEDQSAEAQPLATLRKRDDGEAFDTRARYAFSYDLVTATADAKRANLDAAAEADYRDMVAKGISVLYVGTATFKGTRCTSSDPSYDFSSLPRVVKFRFGFKTPTEYVNCQNTSLRGKAFDGEESQRGVQLAERGETRAQITLHVDHPFWSTVDHDAAELYFDQIAGAASVDGDVTLEDLAAVDPTAFVDKKGKPLPWRSCLADKAPKSGARRFDSGSVPVDKGAPPDRALRSYADFVSYEQSTQGHLNADGLCAVKRLFPAPR